MTDADQPPSRPPPPSEEDLDGPPPARPPPPSAPSRPPAPSLSKAPQRTAPKPPPSGPSRTTARDGGPKQVTDGGRASSATPASRVGRDRAQTWSGKRPQISRNAASAVDDGPTGRGGAHPPSKPPRQHSSVSSASGEEQLPVKPRAPPSRPLSQPKSVAAASDMAPSQRTAEQEERLPVRPPPPLPPGRPAAPPPKKVAAPSAVSSAIARSRSSSSPLEPPGAVSAHNSASGRRRLERSISESSPVRPSSASLISPNSSLSGHQRLGSVQERTPDHSQPETSDAGASSGRRRFSIRGRKRGKHGKPFYIMILYF